MCDLRERDRVSKMTLLQTRVHQKIILPLNFQTSRLDFSRDDMPLL